MNGTSIGARSRPLPGNVVVVSGAVAVALIALPGFAHLRISARGTPLYRQFDAIYRLGLQNAVPNGGTGTSTRAAGVPDWVTTTQAAELLELTERAVVKRLAKGQLEGYKSGGRWRVSRTAVERQLTRRRLGEDHRGSQAVAD